MAQATAAAPAATGSNTASKETANAATLATSDTAAIATATTKMRNDHGTLGRRGCGRKRPSGVISSRGGG